MQLDDELYKHRDYLGHIVAATLKARMQPRRWRLHGFRLCQRLGPCRLPSLRHKCHHQGQQLCLRDDPVFQRLYHCLRMC